ncbi:hypothetical protein [Lysobacter gummosus]|uniref:hypothetical protein n=1 Tax=Lysobacter gummosus TaxID=262324 RepID=UPI003625990C
MSICTPPVATIGSPPAWAKLVSSLRRWSSSPWRCSSTGSQARSPNVWCIQWASPAAAPLPETQSTRHPGKPSATSARVRRYVPFSDTRRPWVISSQSRV